MKNFSFYKYHGDGNDFVIIDDRDSFFPTDDKKLIKDKICKRCFGIGADGLVLLQKSTIPDVDIKMRIFNSDGGEADSCGNALSCTVSLLKDHLLLSKPRYKIETRAGVICGAIEKGRGSIEMVDPKILAKRQKIVIDGREFIYYLINSGVMHAVIFTDDADKLDVNYFGEKIRNDKHFAPNGTNVNFAKICSKGVFLRTYEKGVERETFSCGTGAVATAVATHLHTKKNGFNSVNVSLNIYFRNAMKKVTFQVIDEDVTKLILNSCVNFVYKGVYFY